MFFKDPQVAPRINGSCLRKGENLPQEKLNTPIIVNLDDDTDMDDEAASIVEVHDEADSQREESNAFQVLMNRGKPIQYKSSMPEQPADEAELKERLNELKSKRKERLTALADKKGYSRKKLAELEEGERIDKSIEERMKVFKGSNEDVTHKRDESIELPMKNNRHSGNLLDYFR